MLVASSSAIPSQVRSGPRIVVPKTRYYGSKRSIVDWICSILVRENVHTVLDVFGGTATVSRLLLDRGKEVVFNDAFHFNGDVARAVLMPLGLRRDDLIALLDGVEPTDGVVARNFDGVFYTSEENEWIDGFMNLLLQSGLDHSAKSVARYCLYQACLKKRPYNIFHRSNLSLRTRKDVRRSFGNATTWERSFSHHMMQAYDELASCPPATRPTPRILSATDASAVAPGYDLVYIDPPYMGEVRHRADGYWRRYHFLEGLSRYETWERELVANSAFPMLPEPTHFRAWSDPRAFQSRLAGLVSRHRRSIVALSYLDNASPSRRDLLEIFAELFPRVDLHECTHKHVLRRGARTELLIVGRPRKYAG